MEPERKQYKAIAVGKDHLDLILHGSELVRRKSWQALEEHVDHCGLIGTALAALFEAATCHRGCNHGPHIFEAICGRAYNLGCSAFLLAMSGFYDESANLVRSVGEIANLVSLSSADPMLFQEWLTSDPETRKKKFSPYKIRMALEKSGGIQIADQEWYTRFCEGYTHVSPGTKPGRHNDEGKGNAGGVFQLVGLNSSLDELLVVLVSLAMLVCKFFGFEDISESLVQGINAVDVRRENP
jgi:hypothetical protein